MACRVAVLNSFMMVDASPVTHNIIMEDKLVLSYVQKISLLLLLVAMQGRIQDFRKGGSKHYMRAKRAQNFWTRPQTD